MKARRRLRHSLRRRVALLSALVLPAACALNVGGSDPDGAASDRALRGDATADVVTPDAVMLDSPRSDSSGSVDSTVSTNDAETDASADSPYSAGRPDAPPVVAITGGERVTCVLYADGHVWCRGANVIGACGNDTPHAAPCELSEVHGVTDAVEIAATDGAMVARRASGELVEWGSALSPAMFDAPATVLYHATAIAGVTDAIALEDGVDTVCALRRDASATCWGWRNLYFTPDSSMGAPSVIRGLDGVVQLVLGGDYGCGRTASGGVLCWGANDHGQLGVATIAGSAVPLLVGGLTDVDELAATLAATCARRRDGTVWCWGSDEYNALGDGMFGSARSAPAPVPGVAGAVQLVSGTAHFCARLASGRVTCWGSNENSQLGIGWPTMRETRIATLELGGARRIFRASRLSTIAELGDGRFVAWGRAPGLVGWLTLGAPPLVLITAQQVPWL